MEQNVRGIIILVYIYTNIIISIYTISGYLLSKVKMSLDLVRIAPSV